MSGAGAGYFKRSSKQQEYSWTGRFATTSTVAALTEGPRGMTLTRTAAGKYTLDFGTGRKDFVSVHACVIGSNLGSDYVVAYDNLDTDSVDFTVQQIADDAFVDVATGEISFAVWGSKSKWD